MNGRMQVELPRQVKRIIETLERQGFEAYAVGGCVRDSLLGRVPQDWDITTSATPAQVKALFERTVDTGIRHGTVTVLMERAGYEVTTYRIDGEYEDARHPKEVWFAGTLTEDLKRRDFTINAMAYNERCGIVDAFDGMGDLERGVVRCVGNSEERFAEDALRMLRAVRFAAQLGFSVDRRTGEAMERLSGNLAKVSAERIQAELVKLLTSEHPGRIRLAYEKGLTRVFLPEFDRMMETPQNNPHHCYTVGEHTIHAVEGVPADRVLRLAMLLHDVAKPACRTTDEKGVDHFFGHQELGAKQAQEILRRLKFDNDTTERVCRLVRWHDDNPEPTERGIRRAIHHIGTEQYPALFAVKRADAMAQSGYRRGEKLAYIDAYEAQYETIMEQKQCLSVRELAVNGSDLIAAGMRPGREIGVALQRLLNEVLEDPAKNRKEQLLALAAAFREKNES